MSLDLYLKSKTLRTKSGTGVYVRKEGKTYELKTLEEVRAWFPDADLSDVKVTSYETDEVWHDNITHNLTAMADKIPCSSALLSLYDLLWRPDEHEFTVVTSEYRKLVSQGLSYMLSNKEHLLQYNPKNGWGSYDQFLDFVMDYCKTLSTWDGTEEWTIVADR